MEGPTTAAQPSADPSIRPPQQLHFTGTGSEYFGIWIVNMLLTIVTLSLYTPWAKVRRLQYFYRHTELAGSSFDFHGNPRRILVGRLLALALFILYQYSVSLHSKWTLAILIGLALVMPWLLRNSLRFRLYNTSWRGTRFHFRGSVPSAYRVFLLNWFLTVITLGLFGPFMQYHLKNYQHGNTWFGQTRCSFHARPGQFYRANLLPTFAAAIVAFVFFTALELGAGDLMHKLAHIADKGPASSKSVFLLLGILYVAFLIVAVFVFSAVQALLFNIIWNNTRLGDHRIEARVSPWTYTWIVASNFVMVVLTLGLFIPWATVRMIKYQVESVALIPASDLQEFVDAEPESVGAIGEEAAAVFDFDIAL